LLTITSRGQVGATGFGTGRSMGLRGGGAGGGGL